MRPKLVQRRVKSTDGALVTTREAPPPRSPKMEPTTCLVVSGAAEGLRYTIKDPTAIRPSIKTANALESILGATAAQRVATNVQDSWRRQYLRLDLGSFDALSMNMILRHVQLFLIPTIGWSFRSIHCFPAPSSLDVRAAASHGRRAFGRARMIRLTRFCVLRATLRDLVSAG